MICVLLEFMLLSQRFLLPAGRGLKSHAYIHSVQFSHHVFLNLHTLKFYCLPDNYEIIDSSLEDITVRVQEGWFGTSSPGSYPRAPGGLPYWRSGKSLSPLDLENLLSLWEEPGKLKKEVTCAQSHSRIQLSGTPWTAAHQAPLSMGLSRQEYWSGLPFPPPGDLPDPGLNPTSSALAGRFLTTEPPG